MGACRSEPQAPIRVDCLLVQQGSHRDSNWTLAPDRRLAKAWAPLASALEDDRQRLVRMPAHCTQHHVGSERLGNGSLLTEVDLKANAFVDLLAKEVAKSDRIPAAVHKDVCELDEAVAAVATWLGH